MLRECRKSCGFGKFVYRTIRHVHVNEQRHFALTTYSDRDHADIEMFRGPGKGDDQFEETIFRGDVKEAEKLYRMLRVAYAS